MLLQTEECSEERSKECFEECSEECSVNRLDKLCSFGLTYERRVN